MLSLRLNTFSNIQITHSLFLPASPCSNHLRMIITIHSFTEYVTSFFKISLCNSLRHSVFPWLSDPFDSFIFSDMFVLPSKHAHSCFLQTGKPSRNWPVISRLALPHMFSSYHFEQVTNYLDSEQHSQSRLHSV